MNPLKQEFVSSESASTLEDLCTPDSTSSSDQTAESTAFFKSSPLFIGQTKFTPLPEVKSILITGGAGFIASYVVRHFVHQYPEYKVVSYDKLDYCASTNNHLALDDCPNFIFEKGDITGRFCSAREREPASEKATKNEQNKLVMNLSCCSFVCFQLFLLFVGCEAF